MMQKREKGSVLFEVLVGGFLILSMFVLVLRFTVLFNKARNMITAQEDVRGIARVLVTSGRVPNSESKYRDAIERRWVRVFDPWGNYYRIAVSHNLKDVHFSSFCRSDFNIPPRFNVKLPDGRVIQNVIYVIWTRPTRFDNVPTFTDDYGRDMLTTMDIPSDAIYEIYTLNMHRTLYCSN